MKAYLIKASAGSDYSTYKAETGGPPQNIFSTAAATPSWVELEMVDETIGAKANYNSSADVVAIFMSTPDAYRAYALADHFKSQQKVVVLGGLHTAFLQEEAAKHADALLIGETEEIWPQLLEDVINNDLKPVYKRTTPFDLKKVNPYPTHLIHPKDYNYVWSVLVSRGCPYHCDFCLVPKFFDEFSYRPIEHIVKEVKQLKKLGVEWVELHSDNLTVNKKYAIELFQALEPLNMKFYGETTVLIARDTELLEAAQKAGLKALLFGIETPNAKALKAQGKGFVKPNKIKEYVQIVKSYGIEVWGDFLFGFDEHTESIFQETLDFIHDIKIDRAIPHLVIPFPGSDTFKKLESENRIISTSWDKYDGNNCVYKPKLMSPTQLENGVYWIWESLTQNKDQDLHMPSDNSGISTMYASAVLWVVAAASFSLALWYQFVEVNLFQR